RSARKTAGPTWSPTRPSWSTPSRRIASTRCCGAPRSAWRSRARGDWNEAPTLITWCIAAPRGGPGLPWGGPAEACMTPPILLRRARGPIVEGSALVMREGFSPRYDLDRTSGVISRIGHSAEGENLRDRIVIIPTAKGGVAGGWAFYDLLRKGFAPRALV